MDLLALIKTLENYPSGHKKLDDPLFAEDLPPAKYTIYDSEEEDHLEFSDESNVKKKPCPVPNCKFEANSLLDFENHYNTSHRYSCVECKKSFTTPHYLDLHVEESHDSFFAVASLKKPMYCCYIEECKEKFWKPEERLEHGVTIHNLPKNFRFDQTHLKTKSNKKNKHNKNSMEVDLQEQKVQENKEKTKKFRFVNNKQRGFYTGKKFTDDGKIKENSVNMDAIMIDLKDCLPPT